LPSEKVKGDAVDAGSRVGGDYLDVVAGLFMDEMERFYGLLRVLRRRAQGPSGLRKPLVGLVGFERTTCGLYIHDSPCTRRAFQDSSRRP
jgi:hypothetical protein